MSDEDEEGLYDPYEARPVGDLAPVVSWKKSDVGDGFTGVLLPAKPVERPDKAYALRQEYKQADKKEGREAGYAVWPPKNNTEGIKRPVSEADYAKNWPDLDVSKARKVSQVHFTFETGLTDGSLISSKTKERMEDSDPPKDPKAETRRRIIEQGADLPKKIAAALKSLGGKPQVGQTWYIGIAAKEANEYDGETTIYKVDIKAPTEESRKVVVAYVESAVAKANAEADAKDPDDPYVGGAAPTGNQEPPPF